MRILGIDTSSIQTNVAIIEDKNAIAIAGSKPQKTHSHNLLSLIHDALAECSLEPAQMDFFAVTTGPGSFTGLRIGLATALGLADSVEKPVLGIGALDAMAYNKSGWDAGYVCPVLNARRGEVYYALYIFRNGDMIKITDDMADTARNLAERIDGAVYFIGDGFDPYSGIFREVIKHHIEVESVPARPVALGAALAAYDKIVVGLQYQYPPVPRYVRKSQAELDKITPNR